MTTHATVSRSPLIRHSVLKAGPSPVILICWQTSAVCLHFTILRALASRIEFFLKQMESSYWNAHSGHMIRTWGVRLSQTSTPSMRIERGRYTTAPPLYPSYSMRGDPSSWKLLSSSAQMSGSLTCSTNIERIPNHSGTTSPEPGGI